MNDGISTSRDRSGATFASPERSLDDKRNYRDSVNVHLESARASDDPQRQRWADRVDRTGQMYVLGIDGKVYPGSAHLPYETWHRILEMHRDGYSMRKIAAAVGCSVGTAHRIAKNYVLQEAE